MKTITNSIWFPKTSEKAVLLFHGLASSSFETRGLAEYLTEKNLAVYSPTLSFHQSRRLADLKKANLATWKKDARKAYRKVSSFKKVFAGGISNGALLAAYLARQYSLAGLIMICPPIKTGFSIFKYLPQEKIFKWLGDKFEYLPRFDFHMVQNWSLAKNLPRFRKLPAHFSHQAILLARETRENLSKIKSPLLVIQAKYDNRSAPEGIDYLLKNVGSETKDLFLARNSGHVVLLDNDRQEIFEKIARFINRL
ncbi:MAG: alpha/beta fold hydrolase [Candidatus Pacebacteria bacterium]|nr:alpha/beta fold hydrolase [Candidatus Paceibacterota bacterium]